MSGSYDRRPGAPPPPGYGHPSVEFYDEPTTGHGAGHLPGRATGQPGGHPAGHPPGHGYSEGDHYGGAQPPAREGPRRPVPHLEAPERPEPPATGRARRGERAEFSNAPIVPAATVTGRSLTLVIAIMCFLACLTAGAVWMIYQSSNAWLKDIASEVTVQVEPRDRVDTDKTLIDVIAYLSRQPGIRAATPISVESSAKLLEPWLGQSDVLKSLPVPRLVAIELDRTSPPDFEKLRASLGQRFQGVTLDDHRQWQRQIRTVVRSFALGGMAILVLVALATAAIIVSAARSAMASNRDIVEVLHFVGATDRFIAREFDKHFLRLGIRAGLMGAVGAGAVFLAMPSVMQLLGGGSVTVAEIQRLVGVGTLDAAGFAILGAVVVVIAALCMITSRVGVFRILNSQH